MGFFWCLLAPLFGLPTYLPAQEVGDQDEAAESGLDGLRATPECARDIVAWC